MTFSFVGPDTSETATPNPFTDYRLLVDFMQGDQKITVRGYYAADGNAAETGATSGNVWRVHFAAPTSGVWTWSAKLEQGAGLARSRSEVGESVELSADFGRFEVKAPTPILRADGRYFRLGEDGQYWLKGGTNSPENLLAYRDFDGTFRTDIQIRTGESNATDTALHHYDPHVKDWRAGDPVWKGEKGKGLIGAINYLSEQGMNAAYFLTFNVEGDGKDVWPHLSPDDFTRFDVSKLDQWNVVFDHMMTRGIAAHIVLQETENELLMDGGETGPDRQLYLAELIARFGHHPAIIWNLGEENGPVFWRPEGQTDAQRKAMIDYLTAHDPYDHPILLHTHSEVAGKDDIALPLLGYEGLDGLSFQISDRHSVNAETRRWHHLSRESGRDWLLSMDEIGPWHMGALPDADDPNHDSLRRHALWGHLLGGGAGVEWYFGAHYEPNDLSTEDWRSRENLWQQTHIALQFYRDHLPWWEMQPCTEAIIDRPETYCAQKSGELYVLYLMDGGTGQISPPAQDEASQTGDWDVFWFDPKNGGLLQRGSVERVAGGERQSLGKAPIREARDWVVLLRAINE